MRQDTWVCFGCGRKSNVCYNTCWKCGITQAESDAIETKHRTDNVDPRPVPPPIDPTAPARVLGDFARLAREENALTSHVIFANTPGEHQALDDNKWPYNKAVKQLEYTRDTPVFDEAKPYTPLSTWEIVKAGLQGVAVGFLITGVVIAIIALVRYAFL